MKLKRLFAFVVVFIFALITGFQLGSNKTTVNEYIHPNVWRTFESGRSPFTLKYPSNVIIVVSPNSSVYDQPTVIDSIEINSKTNNGEVGSSLGYIVTEKYQYQNGVKPEDQVLKLAYIPNDYRKDEPKPTVSETIINGQLVYEVNFLQEKGVYNSGADIQYYIFRHGLLYRVGITAKQLQNQELMKQILQTFKSEY